MPFFNFAGGGRGETGVVEENLTAFLLGCHSRLLRGEVERERKNIFSKLTSEQLAQLGKSVAASSFSKPAKMQNETARFLKQKNERCWHSHRP